MINTENNSVEVTGAFESSDLRRLLAAIHGLIVKRSYQDINIDFSACTRAYAGPIIALCTQIRKYRYQTIDFEFILPKKEKLSRLFLNTNWAHIIDPAKYQASTFRGLKQVPATQFYTFEEQNSAVNSILDIMLNSLSGFSREDFTAIEWSINEITDNVINHSKSDIGGFVQLSTFQRNRKRIEYVVCDAGLGIPNTLRPAHPEITSDGEALDFAIREGVTKNPDSNQGNGLFGAFQVSRVSEGYIEIHSGHGYLFYNKKQGLHIRTEQIPFSGTLIVACIDYSDPGLLGQALKFGGKPHYPTDYIETKFEDSSGNKVIFSMVEESKSFGSRKAAEPVNIKLKNLSNLCNNCKIYIDFKNIPVISSSFADEVFGKLFVEMGPLRFIQKFEFMNISDTVRSLIDRSITLRSSTNNA